MENIKVRENLMHLKQAMSVTGADITGVVLSFMLGRAVIFEIMSPFALAFLAAYATNNPEKTVRSMIIGTAALLGTLTTTMGLMSIKYVLAFILFELIFIAITTVTDKYNTFTAPVSAATAMAISGIIFLAQWERSLYYIAMLAAECVICFTIAAACARSIKLIYMPKTGETPTPDAVAGLLAIAAFSVLGFGGLSVGGISIGNALAGVYIMLIALCGGIGTGSAGGIGIGLLYSFAMYPSSEYLGIFAFCGLLCGFLSRYKRIGIIAGFVLANALLYFYFGAVNGSALSIPEIAAAAALFCLIPRTAVIAAENIMATAVFSGCPSKKTAEIISKRLTSVAASLRELAEDLSVSVFKRRPDNTNDCIFVFDKAADRVCKRCGLRFVCWEREFTSTYDDMLKLSKPLREKNSIDTNDLPPHFRSKCIKSGDFISAVNKVYLQYKIDTMWMKRVEACKELASEQLYGVSEIMRNLSDYAETQADYEPNPDHILFLAMERYGVRCCDVYVTRSRSGQFEVSLRVNKKGKNSANINQLIDITSQTFGRRFYEKPDSLYDEGKRFSVKLLERERYNVTYGAAVRTKDGSEGCGDSYGQRRLLHNRHIVILSDGMGSGKNARKQSDAAVNIMLRLLNSGFSKETSAKLLNLSLFLRPDEETFATVDAAVIDLFEGSAEFIKIGAVASYIKRDSSVRKVSSNSLPAGILTDICACTEKVDILPGDTIVMTTDGVFGSDGGDDLWLTELIASTNEKKPQKLAEQIVRDAVIRGGHKATDDITVIVLQIDAEVK